MHRGVQPADVGALLAQGMRHGFEQVDFAAGAARPTGRWARANACGLLAHKLQVLQRASLGPAKKLVNVGPVAGQYQVQFVS